MDEGLREEVSLGIALVDELLDAYAEVLEAAAVAAPRLVEMTCVASVLHSFYNGVEDILIRIARQLDEGIPDGAAWHRALLDQMAQPTPARPCVLRAETVAALDDYLRFRHFYRHSSSYKLQWDKMEDIAASLNSVWAQVKSDIVELLRALPEVSRPAPA